MVLRLSWYVSLHGGVNYQSDSSAMFFKGGFQPGTGTIPVPDWVDSTVADWIESEVGMMEAAWGSLDSISAVGFVHIPP